MMTKSIIAVLFAFSLAVSHMAVAEEGMSGGDAWLPDLITDTPEEGFALAVKLSRMGVNPTLMFLKPCARPTHAIRTASSRPPT